MADALWTNLRAVKSTRMPYIWHIEGIWNHEGNPEDDESWGWVADVNEAGPMCGSQQEGDTAKALAYCYNAHDDLVAALQVLQYPDGHFRPCFANPLPCLPNCAQARAALAKVRAEVAS